MAPRSGSRARSVSTGRFRRSCRQNPRDLKTAPQAAPLTVVATYSLVACDLDVGQWGVVVQSKFLAVGSVVPWAEPYVGAIATQSYANPRYGPDGLALLRSGKSADEALEALTSADKDRDQRQAGIVDGQGRAATFTGSGCHDWAGHRNGPCYAAQGNILV